MLVGTCRFYSPLPLCEHESRLAGPVFEHGHIGKEKPCRYFARGGGGEGAGNGFGSRFVAAYLSSELFLLLLFSLAF